MLNRKAYFDVDEWVVAEKHKLDGSNFLDWLVRLNSLLAEHDMVDYICYGMDLEPPKDGMETR